MKKLFGETKITWKFLIIFSILLGFLVAILNRIPILNDTSFQDIAIVLDMWIILAIFIIVNCHSSKEAILKCFIFFLISQPLIYLVEVVIDSLIYKLDFWSNLVKYFRNYYYGAGWLKMTLLTIPGSFIAYQIKKDNLLSAIILSVATAFLAGRGINVLIYNTIMNFPRHYLNSILCITFAYYLIFLIINKKNLRKISIVLTTIGLFIGIFMFFRNDISPNFSSKEIEYPNNIIIEEVYSENNNIATVFINNDNSISIYTGTKLGTTKVIVVDNEKKEYVYLINSKPKEFIVTEIEE